MENENVTPDVIEESSSSQDVETESSTEELAETPAQQAVPEEQHVPYDRFKEVAEEKNYWRDKYAEITSRQPVVQTQPEVDPLANADPQTKLFYQDLDNRTKAAISVALQEKEREYRAQIDALAIQNAKVQERLFRQDQKDVLPGSREENEIAQYIRMGMDPDKATWAVMGPKRVDVAKSVKTVKQQDKLKMKAQANLETPGIQENSGLPPPKTVDFRNDLDRRMKEAGL